MLPPAQVLITPPQEQGKRGSYNNIHPMYAVKRTISRKDNQVNPVFRNIGNTSKPATTNSNTGNNHPSKTANRDSKTDLPQYLHKSLH
jgi:hypothetical protein